MRNWIIRRGQDFCEYCHERRSDQVHHRIDARPWSSYTNPDVRDLMAVCVECHDYIHGKAGRPHGRILSPLDLNVPGLDQWGSTAGSWYRFRRDWPRRWYGYIDRRVEDIGLFSFDSVQQRGEQNAVIELCGRNKTVTFFWSFISEHAVLPRLPKRFSFEGIERRHRSHCYRCRIPNLDSDHHPICTKCGWILCPRCVACGCDYTDFNDWG